MSGSVGSNTGSVVQPWGLVVPRKVSAELVSAVMAPTLIGGAVAAGYATLGIGLLMGLQGLVARSLEAPPSETAHNPIPWGASVEPDTVAAPAPVAAALPASVRQVSASEDALPVPLIAQAPVEEHAGEPQVEPAPVVAAARLPFQPIIEEQAAEAPAAVTGKARPPGLAGPRGGKPDNLKAIGGIGPKLETILNDFGVYHFDQIAAWTPQEAEWIEEYLKFPGRVARDRWIDQAKALTDKH